MFLILNRYHKEEKIILKESKESVERKHFRYISMDFTSYRTGIFSGKRISLFTTRKIYAGYATI